MKGRSYCSSRLGEGKMVSMSVLGVAGAKVSGTVLSGVAYLTGYHLHLELTAKEKKESNEPVANVFKELGLDNESFPVDAVKGEWI